MSPASPLRSSSPRISTPHSPVSSWSFQSQSHLIRLVSVIKCLRDLIRLPALPLCCAVLHRPPPSLLQVLYLNESFVITLYYILHHHHRRHHHHHFYQLRWGGYCIRGSIISLFFILLSKQNQRRFEVIPFFSFAYCYFHLHLYLYRHFYLYHPYTSLRSKLREM